jgi:signal peptidase I
MAQAPPTQPTAQQTQQPMQGYMRVDRKKPWLAALLGLIFVGLGLFYLGKWLYGILLIIVTIILSVVTGFLAAPVFWIISVVWSYYAAKSYNSKAGYPD